MKTKKELQEEIESLTAERDELRLSVQRLQESHVEMNWRLALERNRRRFITVKVRMFNQRLHDYQTADVLAIPFHEATSHPVQGLDADTDELIEIWTEPVKEEIR